jgi:hypothetical protein
MEMALLSETVATFLFTLLMYTWVRLEAKNTAWAWGGLGFLAALLALTRPSNIFLVPFLLGWKIIHHWKALPLLRLTRLALLFGCAALLPMLAWCSALYRMTGHFTMSNYTGMHLTNKIMDWIELAPPKYANIRDILKKYSGKEAPLSVTVSSRIWVAIPELCELKIYTTHKTGPGLGQLSKILLQMDKQMILEHPDLYAKNVWEAFCRFWHPHPFFQISPEPLSDPQGAMGGSVVLRPAWQSALGKPAYLEDKLVHAAVWVFPWGILLYTLIFWRISTPAMRFPILVGLVICAAALGCSLIEYGTGRFVLPYVPILGCALITAIYNTVGCKITIKAQQTAEDTRVTPGNFAPTTAHLEK